MTGPIEVNDDYLIDAASVHDRMSYLVLDAPGGTIAAVPVAAGAAGFELGQALQKAVADQGTAVGQRLGNFSSTLADRAVQLTEFAATTDGAEGIANLDAATFLRDLPEFGTGPAPAPPTA
jgi:hypothetical protein